MDRLAVYGSGCGERKVGRCFGFGGSRGLRSIVEGRVKVNNRMTVIESGRDRERPVVGGARENMGSWRVFGIRTSHGTQIGSGTNGG